MNQPPPGNLPPPTPGKKQFNGKLVVLVGALIAIAVTAFVITRIVQTLEPTPDPDSIPARPSRDSG